VNANPTPDIVVLVSGRGSNLQALIDAEKRGEIRGNIRAVISNRPEVYALERARRAGISTAVIDHTRYSDRPAFDRELMASIEIHQPELIAMAGFMRILTPEFIARFEGRMLNIHPSLLPAFRGLDTHRRALAAGVKQHGCSVHFVTNDLDAGPVVMQAEVEVNPNDDPESMASRVLQREHVIYPQTVAWFCEGRLRLSAGTVHLDGTPLTAPIMLDEATQCMRSFER
jgi:phosphoribosylglycinamide formyltransferase-1